MSDVLVNKERNLERARALKGSLLRNDILHQMELLADAVPGMLSNLRSRANVTSIDGRVPIAVLDWARYYSEGAFEQESARPFAIPGTSSQSFRATVPRPGAED